VECWRHGELVGGLYGVAIGGLFAGESMFHRETDASKVALLALVDVLRQDADPRRLLDVQWRTDHLGSLGVVDITREHYLRLLAAALACPPAPGLLGG
jgi:leucyl/phenylalanyl-tRNA--protein transferase